jgi:predicted alpha/beta hydrolase family esterase
MPMAAQPPVLIIPGWGNSGPQHWQTLWERAHPQYRRIEQREWEWPDRDEWVEAIDAAIRASSDPPVLVAHSLGCIAIAHWVRVHSSGRAHDVAGAMLVAPADVEAVFAPDAVKGFAPVPLVRFGFPSVVVASRSDDYVSFGRATLFADAWGSSLADAGDAGHINTDAGFGDWPAGEEILRPLIE